MKLIKKLVYAVFLILIVPVTILLINSADKYMPSKQVVQLDSSSPNVLGVPSDKNLDQTEIDWKNSKLSVAFFEVRDSANLNLIANFDDKISASNFYKNNNCNYLVNGGFYTEDNQPTGLFISGNKSLKGFIKNDLLNAVLSVNNLDIPRITRTTPRDSLRLAVQTGPILIENGNELNLNLKRDKQSRRMVAAVTGKNTLLIIAIYDAGSFYNGPLLEDLPAIVSTINKKINLNIADAINLDGGTASAFISELLTLTELSPVGSFLCAR